MLMLVLRGPWVGLLLGGAALLNLTSVVLGNYTTVEIYSDANCQSIPLVVTLETVVDNTSCTSNDTCVATEINDSAYYYARRCATDRFEYASSLFSGAKYLMIDGFREEGCLDYVRSNIFLAAGTCQLASYVGTRSEIATLFNDGSAYMTIYNDSACSVKAQKFDLNASTIQENACYRGYNKFYTSDHTGIAMANAESGSGRNSTLSKTTTSHVSKMSTKALLGIVFACLVIVILPVVVIYWKVRRTKRKDKHNIDRTRNLDVALAVSDKHENEEQYAFDVSPRSGREGTFGSHTGRLAAPALHNNALWTDPVRTQGVRESPLSSHKQNRQKIQKLRSEELRSGDRLRTDPIGSGGHLHSDELCTPPVRGNRLQRQDLSDEAVCSHPMRSEDLKDDHLLNENKQIKQQSVADRVANCGQLPSESVWGTQMLDVDLQSHRCPPHELLRSDIARGMEQNSGQPIHAQRLRGPVTADSVCEDDAVLSSRIPRDSVFVEDLIGRGGYGEVYKGTYEGRSVAVKMLFPETRKNTRYVTEFLTEVKLMTVLDHPRVVQFIGVSWNNLMDLCVVTEFMAGGDLRAWLSDCADNNGSVGFDFTKVKIAAHVVHALVYLHSLTPSVIHRDLKSRNILLSENQDAKLADFGASRERVDGTMTAGVGTSLWIAPEVTMGERYDEKADMFSFGVVLSELDSLQNPYAHAKENNPAGRKMPDTAILQLVAMGKLRVEFSPKTLKGVVHLGTACTSIDPTERPTAAEAYQKLQMILNQEAAKAANAK
uniref:Protein kinase domain-containing protein n=1 Tax=Peronospora matthiolae TaxID=2874970 RepID=A0AAV1UP56_9STRA